MTPLTRVVMVIMTMIVVTVLPFMVTKVIFPTILDVVFIASIINTIIAYCLIANCGFRNESAFLFGFLGAGITGGAVTFISFFVTMSSWISFLNIWRYDSVLRSLLLFLVFYLFFKLLTMNLSSLIILIIIIIININSL